MSADQAAMAMAVAAAVPGMGKAGADYSALAGDLMQNPAVLAALQVMTNRFPRVSSARCLMRSLLLLHPERDGATYSKRFGACWCPTHTSSFPTPQPRFSAFGRCRCLVLSCNLHYSHICLCAPATTRRARRVVVRSDGGPPKSYQAPSQSAQKNAGVFCRP